jgi:outer membrane protein assembly factor BamB
VSRIAPTSEKITGSPAISPNDDMVFVSSWDHFLYAFNASSPDLNVLWSFETENPVQSTPAVGDGFVVVGGDDEAVYCVACTHATCGAVVVRSY